MHGLDLREYGSKGNRPGSVRWHYFGFLSRATWSIAIPGQECSKSKAPVTRRHS